MKNRIKEIRKDSNLNQTLFAEKIGVKQSAVASYETGAREPLDVVVKSICDKFNVNEKWLRTGDGEKYIPMSQNQILIDFANDIASAPDGSIKKRIILAAVSKLSDMTDAQWDALGAFLDSI